MNPLFRHHGMKSHSGDLTVGTPATAADSLSDPSAILVDPGTAAALAVDPTDDETLPSANVPGTGPVHADAGTAGLVIDVNYDSSVTSLATTDPTLFAEYEGAVQTAVQYYESIITNPITVTISFGWGEIDGSVIEPGAVGESIAYVDNTTYGAVYNALQAADTTSTVQIAAAASLPAIDPTDGATFQVTTAEANVLGLYPASQYVGGFVGLDSTAAWSWSQTNVAPGTEDAVGTLEHEISEVLGRSDDAGRDDTYTPLDMFRYTAIDGGTADAPGTAVGARDEPFVAGYSALAQSYFSDNGSTITLPYETPQDVANGADVGDWSPSVPNDSYADDAADGANVVSATDLEEMNVLGYDLACYAAGTRIATPGGEALVESLRPGDIVRTAFGGEAPVVWVGRRDVNSARHPAAAEAWPVRVAAESFGPAQPYRDLFLSPDHAVFTNGVLIPIKQLINGTTIARMPVDQVTYYHVELGRHDVLLAEGLPAESYLDTGNRRRFASCSGVIALRQASLGQKTWQDDAVAPLATDEARVKPVWERLAARAAALGSPLPVMDFTDDPALHLLVDGRIIRPVGTGHQSCLFVLPPKAGAIRLVSRVGHPTERRPWADDWRALGIYVSRIVSHDGEGPSDIPVDHPLLTDGWWNVERAGPSLRRWTDGDARLPLPASARMVEIQWEEGMAYRLAASAPDGRSLVPDAPPAQARAA